MCVASVVCVCLKEDTPVLLEVLRMMCCNCFFLQRIAYCITPEHEHHLVAEGNIRQFTVRANAFH